MKIKAEARESDLKYCLLLLNFPPVENGTALRPSEPRLLLFQVNVIPQPPRGPYGIEAATYAVASTAAINTLTANMIVPAIR